MMSKKKGILNAVFLITVFAITIYAIFHGQDLGELFGYIRNTDYRYWLVAVVCVIFFICSESGHTLYDAKHPAEDKTYALFPVFLCWILFQLYYTIGNRRTAGTDLLYEKG